MQSDLQKVSQFTLLSDVFPKLLFYNGKIKIRGTFIN